VTDPTPKMGRPSPTQDAIRAALSAGPALGMTMVEIREATGRKKQQTANTLKHMMDVGSIFRVDAKPRSRYFLTEAAAEAARPAVLAAEKALRKEMRKASITRSVIAKRERRLADPDRRPPGRPRKTAQEAAVQPKHKAEGGHCWKRVPAQAAAAEMRLLVPSSAPRKKKAPAGPPVVIWPEHVKVKESPPKRDMRFAPADGFVGKFVELGIGRYLKPQQDGGEA
jgi:hypothetical protein